MCPVPGPDPELSLADSLLSIELDRVSAAIEGLSDEECAALLHDWGFWARPKQIAPEGEWFCWLILAGRGFGKTRMGAEWIRTLAEGQSPFLAPPLAPGRIALISQTASDAREVMLAGESGLLPVSHPDFRPHYEPSRRRLIWPNGIQGFLYSADEPDQLRGPQHGAAWADELAKWKNGEKAWSNLILGLRQGAKPQITVTTTPRPIPLLKRLMAEPGTVMTRGSTFENKRNLSGRFLDQVRALYEGSRLGRQELEGEFLEDIPGALWSRDVIDRHRAACAVDLARIVVAVDPPVSHGPDADACGIIVAGLAAGGHVYILDDLTEQGLTPNRWAQKAIAAYQDWRADRIVAEVNNGGDLVETLMRQIAPDISYKALRASRGKIARAEPVAALYERGLVHHVGAFSALEDQLSGYTGDVSEKSPDRLDALVWAVTELVLQGRAPPRIRMI